MELAGGNPTFMANNHIHFNTGKGLHPQVIAVSITASICLTKCSRFSSVTAVPHCVHLGKAIGGQPPLHLGSGLTRASVDAKGKHPPRNTLTLLLYHLLQATFLMHHLFLELPLLLLPQLVIFNISQDDFWKHPDKPVLVGKIAAGRENNKGFLFHLRKKSELCLSHQACLVADLHFHFSLYDCWKLVHKYGVWKVPFLF